MPQKISIYNVEDDPIGSGGMGEIYLGTDPKDNVVAIKKMRAELMTDAGLRAFFHREVNTLKKLEHESIVKMYASFEESGNLYLVMEYVEGETIEKYVRSKGAIPENEAIRLLRHILPALDYMHKMGYVHRDIKPSNIIIKPNGKICLLDFGIVKDMKHGSGHTVSLIIGTDGYMSIEQAQGLSIDHRSDIYSLGCVLFYMLTGAHAIQKQSNDYDTRMAIIEKPFPRAKTYNPNLSDKIQRILDKATHKSMLKRFQSCREFELELSGGATVVVDDKTDTISIGRESCDIIVSHPKISRHHADMEKIICSEGVLYKFKDSSTNGTIINAEKVHNDEKEILIRDKERRTPVIRLAGVEELKWEDVEAAFAKKQGGTKSPKLPASPFAEQKATGRLIAIYIFVLLGGWLGLIFGITTYCAKAKLPNGKKVYKYKNSHRIAALIGAVLCVVSIMIWIVAINS